MNQNGERLMIKTRIKENRRHSVNTWDIVIPCMSNNNLQEISSGEIAMSQNNSATTVNRSNTVVTFTVNSKSVAFATRKHLFSSLPQKRFSKYNLLVHYKLRVKIEVLYVTSPTAEHRKISRYHIFSQ